MARILQHHVYALTLSIQKHTSTAPKIIPITHEMTTIGITILIIDSIIFHPTGNKESGKLTYIVHICLEYQPR